MDRLEKLTTWHHVSSARYLGPVRFLALWEILRDQIGTVFEMSDEELKSLGSFMTRQAIQGLRDQSEKRDDSRRYMEKQIALEAECPGGKILTLDHDLYPEPLRRSKMSHAIIYCRGNVDALRAFNWSVGIVGTRKPAHKSSELARNVAEQVVSQGGVVVSGMALGIDSDAHRAALDGRGKTIAVLGSGPDVVYPKKHTELYERIVESGLVLSEYGFGEQVSQLKLRKRNKTTVALSTVLFLVESKADGGAMNAIRACREQNKHAISARLPWTCDDAGNQKALLENAIDAAHDGNELFGESPIVDRVATLVRESIADISRATSQ